MMENGSKNSVSKIGKFINMDRSKRASEDIIVAASTISRFVELALENSKESNREEQLRLFKESSSFTQQHAEKCLDSTGQLEKKSNNGDVYRVDFVPNLKSFLEKFEHRYEQNNISLKTHCLGLLPKKTTLYNIERLRRALSTALDYVADHGVGPSLYLDFGYQLQQSTKKSFFWFRTTRPSSEFEKVEPLRSYELEIPSGGIPLIYLPEDSQPVPLGRSFPDPIAWIVPEGRKNHFVVKGHLPMSPPSTADVLVKAEVFTSTGETRSLVSKHINLESLKLLLVEDNPDIRELFKVFLKNYDCEVSTCSNGFQAVDRISRGFLTDLIFMDIEMPRMNGFEALESLRNLGFTNPVIAVSANNENSETGRKIKRSFDGFLQKPFSEDQIIRVISQQIEGKKDLHKGERHEMKDPAYRSAFKVFHSCIQKYFDELSSGYDQKNVEIIEKVSHRIKGSSSCYGYREVAAAANLINKEIRGGNYSWKSLKDSLLKLKNEMIVIEKDFVFYAIAKDA